MESELSYLKRRAGEERQAAAGAATPEARAAHEGLAERYERRLTAANVNAA